MSWYGRRNIFLQDTENESDPAFCVQDLFRLGMKRNLPPLLSFPGGRAINVGSSPSDTWDIPSAVALGLPNWVWPRDPIPFSKESVSTIHCYHFLEHLTGVDAIRFLREAERVMIPGASVLNFCMPYYNSSLQAECLDHKSMWNESTFGNLFNNSGYDVAGEWKLKVHFQMIAGIVERNLCIIGQLTR